MLTLHRSYCWEHGTWGVLTLPDGSELATLELPWLGNERGRSCIPEGIYRMAMRESPVVERSSGGEFSRGWEIQGVPDRAHIMIHPGNWTRNSDGCLLVGMKHAIIDGAIAVANSRQAFRIFMRALDGRERVDIDIRPNMVSYP